MIWVPWVVDDRAIGVEEVAHVHGYGVPVGPLTEGHCRPAGVDACRSPPPPSRWAGCAATCGAIRVLGDAGALGVKMGERWRAHRSDDRGGGPVPIVEAGAGPPEGVPPGVDPLHEVAAVVVALRCRKPFGRPRPPPTVGAEVPRSGRRRSGRRPGRAGRGPRSGRPRPGPYQWWRMPTALSDPARSAAVTSVACYVLLVGEAEARPGGHCAPLTHNWYGGRRPRRRSPPAAGRPAGTMGCAGRCTPPHRGRPGRAGANGPTSRRCAVRW